MDHGISRQFYYQHIFSPSSSPTRDHLGSRFEWAHFDKGEQSMTAGLTLLKQVGETHQPRATAVLGRIWAFQGTLNR